MSDETLDALKDIMLAVSFGAVICLIGGLVGTDDKIDHLNIHIKALETRVQDLEVEQHDKVNGPATASGEGSVANTGDDNAINWAMTPDNVIVPAHKSDPAHCIAGQIYLDTHDPAHKVLKGCVGAKWKVVEDWREQ